MQTRSTTIRPAQVQRPPVLEPAPRVHAREELVPAEAPVLHAKQPLLRKVLHLRRVPERVDVRDSAITPGGSAGEVPNAQIQTGVAHDAGAAAQLPNREAPGHHRISPRSFPRSRAVAIQLSNQPCARMERSSGRTSETTAAVRRPGSGAAGRTGRSSSHSDRVEGEGEQRDPWAANSAPERRVARSSPTTSRFPSTREHHCEGS